MDLDVALERDLWDRILQSSSSIMTSEGSAGASCKEESLMSAPTSMGTYPLIEHLVSILLSMTRVAPRSFVQFNSHP